MRCRLLVRRCRVRVVLVNLCCHGCRVRCGDNRRRLILGKFGRRWRPCRRLCRYRVLYRCGVRIWRLMPRCPVGVRCRGRLCRNHRSRRGRCRLLCRRCWCGCRICRIVYVWWTRQGSPCTRTKAPGLPPVPLPVRPPVPPSGRDNLVLAEKGPVGTGGDVVVPILAAVGWLPSPLVDYGLYDGPCTERRHAIVNSKDD